MHDHDPRRRPGHGPQGPQREEPTTAKPRPTSNAESHPPRSGLTDPGGPAPSDGPSRGDEHGNGGTAAETGTGSSNGPGATTVPEDDFTRGGTATGAADPTTAIVPRTTTSAIDRWQAGTDLPTSVWLPALVAGGVVAATVGVSTWTHLGGTPTATVAAILAGAIVIGASLLAINVGWRVGLPEDVLTGGR